MNFEMMDTANFSATAVITLLKFIYRGSLPLKYSFESGDDLEVWTLNWKELLAVARIVSNLLFEELLNCRALNISPYFTQDGFKLPPTIENVHQIGHELGIVSLIHRCVAMKMSLAKTEDEIIAVINNKCSLLIHLKMPWLNCPKIYQAIAQNCPELQMIELVSNLTRQIVDSYDGQRRYIYIYIWRR